MGRTRLRVVGMAGSGSKWDGSSRFQAFEFFSDMVVDLRLLEAYFI